MFCKWGLAGAHVTIPYGAGLCRVGKMHKEPCKSIWLGQVFKDHADLKYSLFSKAKLNSYEEKKKS